MATFLSKINRAFWHSQVGAMVAEAFIRFSRNHVFSTWTADAMQLDALRLRARIANAAGNRVAEHPKLHLGCGRRIVAGWVNADIIGGDCIVDLGCGRLPWKDQSFDAIVCQQVIEHLELDSELIPLLREMNRVTKDGGEIWLACPDLEKACQSYVATRGADMIEHYARWIPKVAKMRDCSSQVINVLFHQDGEHKNLLDFQLLEWAGRRAGLTCVERQDEAAMLKRFPEFPERGDDQHSLYARLDVNHHVK